MQGKIKVVMLLGRFYPVESGAEIQCKRLSKKLLENGNEVHILTQRLPGLKKKDIIEGLNVFRAGFPLKGIYGSISFFFSGLFWLTINRKKYDIVHAHLASLPAVLAGIISVIFKKSSVLKFGCSGEAGDVCSSSSTLHGRIKLKFLSRTIDAFVCLSLEIQNEILNAGFKESKIHVISNGIDTDTYSPATSSEKIFFRKTLSLYQNSTIVLYAGRFEKEKGLEVLLKAWPKVILDCADKRPILYLIGNGSLFNSLKISYEMSNSVIFMNRKENLIDYLKSSDIFVLPSFCEGMPNSLMEAMSCGLACVSTKIGGVIELIKDNESGILVAPNSIHELSDALVKMILNTELALRFGNEARVFCVQNLVINNILLKYLQLYSQLA